MTSLRVPEFGEVDPFHRRLHQITQAGLSPDTASGNHHHGESETAIYVVSGRPEFAFLEQIVEAGTEAGPGHEVRVRAAPGDFIFVPPWIPHREENPDPDIEAIVVIDRSTQEAIVVDLEGLEWAGPVLTGNKNPLSR